MAGADKATEIEIAASTLNVSSFTTGQPVTRAAINGDDNTRTRPKVGDTRV